MCELGFCLNKGHIHPRICFLGETNFLLVPLAECSIILGFFGLNKKGLPVRRPFIIFKSPDLINPHYHVKMDYSVLVEFFFHHFHLLLLQACSDLQMILKNVEHHPG